MKRLMMLMFVFISITVMAAPESATLEYKLDGGSIQAFQLITTTKSEFSIFGIDQKTGSKLILNIHRETEKGSKPGTFNVKNVVDSGKIIIQGKESKYAGEGSFTQIIMDKTGKILENLDESGKKINELQVNFPSKAVKPGDVWGTKAKFDISDISSDTKDVDISMLFILKGFESYKGAQCAVIETKFESNEIREKNLNINIKGNGKMYFDYEEGKLMANFSKLKIDFAIFSDENNENKLRKVFSVSLDMLSQLTSL
ncbi:MAG: hypothetical protein M0R46_04695 [Candidatus Muirbacterium halophilum]|nr:hypothetical protein [Candidatus Muirbacterium halophilum]MCK9475194.1 hypothetical protein [Candidatus Muirbacterium halophilum]